MARWTTTLLACTLAVVAAHGGACTEKATETPLDPALADVVFEGAATPAALDALLAAEPKSDAARAPIIDAPMDGEVIPPSPVTTFRWHFPGESSLLLPAPRVPAPRAPALLPAAERAAIPAWLTALVGPERAAFAADPPLDGTAYFLLFSTSKSPRLLRVFTTETAYTPGAAAWKTLSDAGMWTKLTVFSASFAGDALVAGSGPVSGKPIEFCIMKEP